MGRSVRGGPRSRALRPGEVPETAVWRSLRERLWRQWTGGGRHAAVCYHCSHPIVTGLGTIQHLLSPQAYPALAMAESNLRPCHGGGKRRCQTCGLDCQAVSAGNLAARDEDGRPLPFTERFIALAQARTSAGKRVKAPPSRPLRPKVPVSDTGREWLWRPTGSCEPARDAGCYTAAGHAAVPM